MLIIIILLAVIVIELCCIRGAITVAEKHYKELRDENKRLRRKLSGWKHILVKCWVILNDFVVDANEEKE